MQSKFLMLRGRESGLEQAHSHDHGPGCPISPWCAGFQVAELEREKAAAEADKLALGQRLEREWEDRDAAEATARSGAEAAARSAARDRAALQEALEKVRLCTLHSSQRLAVVLYGSKAVWQSRLTDAQEPHINADHRSRLQWLRSESNLLDRDAGQHGGACCRSKCSQLRQLPRDLSETACLWIRSARRAWIEKPPESRPRQRRLLWRLSSATSSGR